MTDATRDTTKGAGPPSTGGAGATTAGSEWVARFAEALGVPAPGQEEIDALLGLAGTAAHASERTAAPLSTWLVGRAGVRPTDAKALAARLAETLAQGEG